MKISHLIEIGIIVFTLVSLGIPLIQVSRKVSDLEGAELIELSDEESGKADGLIIGSK